MTKVACIHRSTFEKLIDKVHSEGGPDGKDVSVIFNSKTKRILLVKSPNGRTLRTIPGNWWFVQAASLHEGHPIYPGDDDTYDGDSLVMFEIQIVPDDVKESVPS